MGWDGGCHHLQASVTLPFPQLSGWWRGGFQKLVRLACRLAKDCPFSWSLLAEAVVGGRRGAMPESAAIALKCWLFVEPGFWGGCTQAQSTCGVMCPAALQEAHTLRSRGGRKRTGTLAV